MDLGSAIDKEMSFQARHDGGKGGSAIDKEMLSCILEPIDTGWKPTFVILKSLDTKQLIEIRNMVNLKNLWTVALVIFPFISPAQNNIFPTSGSVGIGTSAPGEKLDVIGNVRSQGIVLNTTESRATLGPSLLQAGLGNAERTKRSLHFEIASNWDISQIQLRAGSSVGTMAYVRLQGNWAGGFSDGKGGVYFGPNGVDQHVMLNNGNVGIGTINPQAKLAVEGNIVAKEIKVKTDIAVPDYVFEPGYEILSLEETESYIRAHKHLPEVPSAVIIATEGLDLAEMNLILLKKVEELTLHLIEKDKELKKVNARLDKLEK